MGNVIDVIPQSHKLMMSILVPLKLGTEMMLVLPKHSVCAVKARMT